MKLRAWLSFWLVSAIWGSSFLLIRIGVTESHGAVAEEATLSAAQVAFIRSTIAAIGLNIVLVLRGKRHHYDLGTWGGLALLGIGNAVLPYWLLGLGEQSIESALASIVQAVVPLFALLIAHFALPDEKINPQKLIGLVLGFVGVMVLATRSAGDGKENTLWGILAVVAASLSYAIFTVYSRRTLLRKLDPIQVSSGSFIFAGLGGIVFIFLEPLLGGRAPADLAAVPSGSLFAVLMLGVINTFVAYLFFYSIIKELGAFVASNVTYVVPVFGVLLGALYGESIDARLLLGGALIFAGVAVINLGGRVRAWWAARRVGALA
jgi:drug/metabolite transporter (DMT)-like permease